MQNYVATLKAEINLKMFKRHKPDGWDWAAVHPCHIRLNVIIKMWPGKYIHINIQFFLYSSVLDSKWVKTKHIWMSLSHSLLFRVVSLLSVVILSDDVMQHWSKHGFSIIIVLYFIAGLNIWLRTSDIVCRTQPTPDNPIHPIHYVLFDRSVEHSGNLCQLIIHMTIICQVLRLRWFITGQHITWSRMTTWLWI